MSDDDKLIKGHSYDGIEEYDNPLPGWWLLTFLGTIMFGYFYYLHYESGIGQSIEQELKADLAVVEAAKKARGSKGDTEEDLQKVLASADALEQGKAVYLGKCAVCHGPELQGLIGPNLTDDYWIHGKGKAVEIAGVIRKGVSDKGMPPWEGMLKDGEIQSVTAFVVTRRGSNPANPKAPQGEKIVSQ